jgi:hypothetical protein
MRAALARIEARSIPEPNTGCRLWEGGQNSGYGILNVLGSTFYAHRIVCEAVHGLLGPGVVACHTCDVSFCVEAEHLFPGTYKVNAVDCVTKKRWTRGEKHGRAKLTFDEVTAIRSMRSQGRSAADLADEFSLSPSTIRRIVAGSSWRDSGRDTLA